MPEGVQTVRHLFFAIASSRGRQIQTYMLKYVNTDIVFQEIPDEVTLAVNISNCPCRCPGCHSEYLWEDVGESLTPETIDGFADKYSTDITCISLMGGDADPAAVSALAAYIHRCHPQYKVGWYSGRAQLSPDVDTSCFDYLKLGPYISHLGGLKSRDTNQRLYRRNENGDFEDITSRFWRR